MKISHYEWDPEKDLIAEGGFAEVFRAKDINTANRWVALKIYKEAVSRGTSGSTGQKKYSLEQEFAKIDGLSHTHIISYYGLEYLEHVDMMGRTVSYPVLVMEYAGEGTLSDLMAKGLAPEDTKRIIMEMVSAIAYLHEQGVIHRDLKPGNILFTKDRNLRLVSKVTDFGISRDILSDKTLEQSITEGVGTSHYMAPEQFFKKKFGLNGEISARTDLWALGIILYKLLTGKFPFGEAQKDYELIREEIIEKELDLNELPEAYKEVVNGCLQKEASNRIGSASELLQMLQGKEGVGTVVPTAVATDEKTILPTDSAAYQTGNNQKHVRVSSPEKGKKTTSKLPLIVALFFVIIVAGAGGFWWNRNANINKLLSNAEEYYKKGNFDEAHAEYLKASEYDSGKAYYFLSLMAQHGRGVERDYEKSITYADKAIADGYDMAAFHLGWMHMYGQGVPIDSIKALSYFKQSLDQIKELSDTGEAEAQNLYGIMATSGYIIDKDVKMAFDLTKKAALKGHPSAISNLAYKYEYGLGVDKNCKEALVWYEKGAAIKQERSINGLGRLYYYGCDEIKKDMSKSFAYYKEAAAEGSIEAQHMLGWIYQNGLEGATKKDLDESLWWYRKAAENDHIASMNNLGTIYEGKENYAEAKIWYTKAANKNNKYGAYNLGSLKYSGNGEPVDKEGSLKWFLKAAEQDHKAAQVQAGYIYGNVLTPADNKKSAYWYGRSAHLGYATGQYNYGYMFENGLGNEKNLDSAFHWYSKSAAQRYESAEYALGRFHYYGTVGKKKYDLARSYFLKSASKGNASAQFMTAYMIENGLGGSKSNSTARIWYQKAADQNHASALNELGRMYGSGIGGPKNQRTAYTLFVKSADKNNEVAQYNLAYYYYYGKGVSRNLSRSEFWYKKSCNNGYKTACQQLEEKF
ncbi:serine/threonine-protein kinase [Ascidiimonas sp. W6]|uniref:serine/threonine-protein kinase n=1 Tax=Ascidiimonas meishanensis TaxID=3128903 RepID=UPI0030EEC677